MRYSSLLVLSVVMGILCSGGLATAGSVTPIREPAAASLLWLVKSKCIKVEGKRYCLDEDDDDDDDDEKPKKKDKQKNPQKPTTKKPPEVKKEEVKTCPPHDGLQGTFNLGQCCYTHPAFGPYCKAP